MFADEVKETNNPPFETEGFELAALAGVTPFSVEIRNVCGLQPGVVVVEIVCPLQVSRRKI